MNDTTVFYKYNLFFIGHISEELKICKDTRHK